MSAREKPCPICGKPAEPAFRPFCSRRCADVDLHRWLSGAYVVPGSETDEEDAPPLVPRPEGR
ncbi:MAG TPA: DNA gyrase inhibitor YacG [Xanthobacteraceae bacterium]|nr:DNA gyrase inhibitor YacG [Xanthobacteraceae bacterium]